jgi:probable O-glycosylation ligase (exosortase A-associated)
VKGLLFTYALTYGGAVVGVFNPFYGLLVYVAFAILRPSFLWYWSVPHSNYSEIVAISMLGGWVLAGCGNWNFGRGAIVVGSLIGFWLWALVCGIASGSDFDVVYGFLESSGKIVLPVLVGLTLIDSTGKLKQLAWVLMLCQGYVALEMNLSYYGGFNRMASLGFGGVDNNVNAIAMATGVGLAFFLGLDARRLWPKLVALLAAGLMAHSILFAFSRGGMLALIVLAGVAFWLLPKQPRHYLLFAAGILVVLRLAGPEVQDRFLSAFADKGQRDESAQSRVDMWGNCLTLMKENPIFGVGPDQWGKAAPRFGWNEGKEAHSLWLQTGAETGFVGMGLLLLFYGSCGWRLLPLARGREVADDAFLATAARMVIAALAGFAASATFVTVEGLEIPYYVALLGAGTLRLAASKSREVMAPEPGLATAPPRWWRVQQA